jgi:dihydrofolate reductase
VTLISLVVAVSQNGVIGNAGMLPWRLPSDLKRFKATTMGKPVIMGRKTWDSLPRKPLPGRKNIILTRRAAEAAEGATYVATRDQAISAAGEVDEVCVIGGGEIYAMFLPIAHRIYRSVVALTVEGDTRFPQLENHSDWVLTHKEHQERQPGDDASFDFEVWKRDKTLSR